MFMLYLECYKKDVNYQNISLKSKENKNRKSIFYLERFSCLEVNLLKGSRTFWRILINCLWHQKKQGLPTLLFLINVISYLSRDKVF